VPVYEYEPLDDECLICHGRIEVMQAITAEPYQYCPTCGMEVRRVISRATFAIGREVTPEKAASRGFTTWKKVGKGQWEKQAGPGVDMIVGSEADMQALNAEKKAGKKKG